MTQQVININPPNGGTGDSLYVAGGKINGNFTELYTNTAVLSTITTPEELGAIGDFTSSTTASISSGSHTFGNTSVTFTSADVGKVITVVGAGTNGGTLTTTITAVSGLSATLQTAASATVPGNFSTGGSVATAGTGYVPTDTLIPSGGTSVIAAALSVGTTKVVSATVASGGSGGTNGTANVAGTTGSGTQKFVANVTISGNAITAVNSIVFAGSYSTNPTTITAEPVTGAGLTGATLNVVMGVNSASVTKPGNYSVNPTNPVTTTTSGSGTGCTLNLSFATSGSWSYGTDNTTAITSATTPLYLPEGKLYYTNISPFSYNVETYGFGQLVDNALNAQSPNLIGQTTAPSSTSSVGFIGNAFTGDLSRVYPAGKAITGATTLTQPSSGYVHHPENALHYAYLSNSSGFNSSTSGNGGRTGASAYYTKVDSIGQGDTYCYFAAALVNGAKAGATSFLANPAGALFAGGVTPGQSGVYLNPVEIDNADNGFDVAAINFVANQARTNDIGALGCVWFGYRSQSSGSAAIDAHFSATGKSKIGLDFSALVTNSSGTWQNAAITLLPNDRIYFNSSAPSISPGYSANPGTYYVDYNSTSTGVEVVSGGNQMLLVTSSSAIATGLAMRQGVGTSRVPASNGDLTLEFTSNTSITVRGKGSDGTVRTATITIA